MTRYYLPLFMALVLTSCIGDIKAPNTSQGRAALWSLRVDSGANELIISRTDLPGSDRYSPGRAKSIATFESNNSRVAIWSYPEYEDCAITIARALEHWTSSLPSWLMWTHVGDADVSYRILLVPEQTRYQEKFRSDLGPGREGEIRLAFQAPKICDPDHERVRRIFKILSHEAYHLRTAIQGVKYRDTVTEERAAYLIESCAVLQGSGKLADPTIKVMPDERYLARRANCESSAIQIAEETGQVLESFAGGVLAQFEIWRTAGRGEIESTSREATRVLELCKRAREPNNSVKEGWLSEAKCKLPAPTADYNSEPTRVENDGS